MALRRLTVVRAQAHTAEAESGDLQGADDGLVTSTTLRLRVQASAHHDEVVAIRNGVLVVRVTAPAVEGRANEALRRLVAKRLGVPKSAIMLVRGHHSRDKVIEIDGVVDQSTVLARLTD